MTRALSIAVRTQRMTHSVLMSTCAPIAVAMALAATPAMAAAPNPVGLPVASFPPPSPGSQWVNVVPGTTPASVTVSGSRAYAEWQSFNVAAGNTFTVNGQVGKDWILVNKVVGATGVAITPSALAGTIAANGQVWVLNQAGIAVSNTGVFNVGGILLSTATNFSKSTYLSGGLGINFTGATTAIQMNGSVNASGGLVTFLAPVVNINGQVRETSPGVSQVVAVAAQDVSLVFTDNGARLALDGVTITTGSDVAGQCASSCKAPGGINLAPGSQVIAGRIILAAAGANLTSSIVVNGALTATQARADGQDIVLMVGNPTGSAPKSGPPTELLGGVVSPGAFTVATGGDIFIDTALINTLPTSVADPMAANGASLFVRDAGSVHIGTLTNAVGDVDISAQGAITQIGASGGAISARDVALGSLASTVVGVVTARDDIRAQGGDFTAAALTAGATVAGQVQIDLPGAADRQTGGTLLGHEITLTSSGSIAVTGSTNAIAVANVAYPLSDVSLTAAGSISTAAVSAGRDISLVSTGQGGIAAGALQGGRDIAVSSGNSITASSADAGDDIVLRAGSTLSVAGALTTHGADVSVKVDPLQAGDLLAAASPINALGVNFVLTGSSIDARAQGAITVGGQVTAAGVLSDVRFQGSDLNVVGVNAGEDVLVYAHAPPAGSGVVAGDLVAGRDVAALADGGAVSLGSAVAGDDIVLRAFGDIHVTGTLGTQGLDVSTSAQPVQAGDLLAAFETLVVFGRNTVLSGASIDIGAGRGGTGVLSIGGAVAAVGTQSDARFIAANSVTLAGVSAGEDVLIDTGSAGGSTGTVVAGTLSAARDVAVRSQTGSLTLASATASDDVVLRAKTSILVSGSVNTQGTDVTGSPTQAGDRLAALDPITSFNHPLALTGSSIDVKAGSTATVQGSLTALGGASDIHVQANGVGGVSLASATAGQDILLDAPVGPTVAGGLQAGRDVAVRGQASIAITSAGASDDVVLRSGGGINVGGGITTNGADVLASAAPYQAGDLLAAFDPINAFNATFALTGSSVDIKSGGALMFGAAISASGPQSDVRIQSVGSLAIANASAGEDILLDGATASGVVSTGNLMATRDIGVRSSFGALTLTSAQSGDDLVLRSASAITVTGGLTTLGNDVSPASAPNQSGDLLYAAAPLAYFGQTLALTGSTIDVNAGGGITVGGASAAAGAVSDARFQSIGATNLAAVTAGEDVVIGTTTVQGGGTPSTLASGALISGRDVVVNGAADSSIGSGAAGGLILIRTQGVLAIAGGLAATGQAAGSPGKAASLLYIQSPTNDLGTSLALVSGTVDVGAVGALTVVGPVTAGSFGDARFVDGGGVTLAVVSAGQDILVDSGANGGAGAVLTGTLNAGRDVALRSGGNAQLASASAGEDLVIRAAGSLNVTATLSTTNATTSASPNSVGILLATASPFTAYGAKLALAGSSVDASAASVSVGGAIAAAGAQSDVRLYAAGAISTGGVTAGEDVLLASGHSTTTGALSSGRDIAISAGGNILLASAAANDDIVVRGGATLVVTGGLSTQGVDSLAPSQAADLLYAFTPSTIAGQALALTGSTIDVYAGTGLTVGGPIVANGGHSDARLFSAGPVTLASITAGEDILVDHLPGSLTGVDATSGALAAGRDITFVSGGAITLPSATAGGVIQMLGVGAVNVSGSLATTNQGGGVGQAAGLVYAQFPLNDLGAALGLSPSTIEISTNDAISVQGAVTSVGATADVRFVGGAVTLASVSAGRDVLIDTGFNGATGNAAALTIVAGRDVALRSGSGVQTASVTAGDDIVIRATGVVNIAGALTTLSQDVAGTTSGQAGDLLFAAAPNTALGGTYTLAGSNIDVVGQQSITVSGQSTAAGVGSDARFQSPGAISLAAVTAGRDVVIDPTSQGASVNAGALIAGEDIALEALAGSLNLVSGQAGDDIVLRSGGALTVRGTLVSTGAGSDGAGAGDRLVALDPIKALWASGAPSYSAGGGHDIDIRSAGPITLGGRLTTTGAGGDVRIDSYGAGGTVSLAGITIASGAGSEQIFIAGSDLALTGPINAPTADVLLFSRASSGLTTLGGSATGQGSSFTFDNTEVGQVTAASLDLFAGIDPGHTGNVAVQTLAFTPGLQTIRVYSGVGSRIDVIGDVTDPSVGGRFTLGAAGTDTALPKFADNGGTLVLTSTWRPDVIRVSGAIGTTGAPLTDVSFAGQSVFIAPKTDAALGSDFETASQSITPLPLYTDIETVQLAAATLELRASNQIQERDLKTIALNPSLGLKVDNLIVDLLDVGGPVPAHVNLFGTVNQALVRFTAGAGGFAFNGCAVAGGCAPAVTTSTVVFLSGDSVVQTSAKQETVASQAPPRIVIRNVQEVIDPYTPVEEEGVTNMGGEIDWMSQIEPDVCSGSETTLCKSGDGGTLKSEPTR